MAQVNIVQEGVERVRDAVSSVESDLQRAQKRLEKRWASRRKRLERETQKRVKRVRAELRKNAYVKRAQEVVDDATRQFEQAVDSLLGVLQIASRRDVNRIDRKLGQINRKLRDLEKTASKPASSRRSGEHAEARAAS